MTDRIPIPNSTLTKSQSAQRDFEQRARANSSLGKPKPGKDTSTPGSSRPKRSHALGRTKETGQAEGRGIRRPTTRKKPISTASKEQRDKVRDMTCLICTNPTVDPAHVVPRSLGGCDDALCVVPLCRLCHRLVDDGKLDLLPYLEPRFRDEQAHAVSHVGLQRALWRVAPSEYRRAA